MKNSTFSVELTDEEREVIERHLEEVHNQTFDVLSKLYGRIDLDIALLTEAGIPLEEILVQEHRQHNYVNLTEGTVPMFDLVVRGKTVRTYSLVYNTGQP